MPIVYKKKPEEFGAIQWTGENFDDIKVFTAGFADLQNTKVIISNGRKIAAAFVGDWIVANLDTEEFHTISDKVFKSKYEISHEVKFTVKKDHNEPK